MIYALLPGKTGQIYEKMMNYIMELVPGWSPQRMMRDFEKAATNAVSGRFPGIELSRCFFICIKASKDFYK